MDGERGGGQRASSDGADTSSADSLERSVPEAAAQNSVAFPPARLADFVIHYRDAAFVVHKFVLFHHSPYFRAYIETLSDGQRSCPPHECSDHPGIAHCIRLPDSCGKVEASADGFRLFLCHLYFPAHYLCTPYPVATHVDPTADPPVTLRLGPGRYSEYWQLVQVSSYAFFGSAAPALYREVVSLSHYFDCAYVLGHVEREYARSTWCGVTATSGVDG